MAYKSSYRYARISASKVRPMANLIRGKFADEALEILKYQPHRGARMLEKVLKSALANGDGPSGPGGSGGPPWKPKSKPSKISKPSGPSKPKE